MDLRTLIHEELWGEISNSYESGNYKNSILDAVRYLSKVIRDKSGLDGDGASLVGQAFGGDEPVLRINRLQTQSERDEQKGFQQILLGLYQGIRNPRTHSEKKDSQETANRIIYFIDFVLTILDAAKPPFTIQDFLPRIFDPDFVEREDYTEEIVKEIPREKRLEILIEIFKRKTEGNGQKLFYVVREILFNLSESEQKQFLAVVSDEFDRVSDNTSIATSISMLPVEFWGSTRKTATLRIENKLIASVKTGKKDIKTNKINQDGTLGPIIEELIPVMTLRDELIQVLRQKLVSNNVLENYYVLSYFLYDLPHLFVDKQTRRMCIYAIHRVIGAHSFKMKEMLIDFMYTCPKEWRDEIVEQFKDFTDSEHPEYYTVDGVPFLGSIPPPEDEIPF